MEEFWIIGAGRFGYIAFQRLSEAGKQRHFVLVDSVEENLVRCKGPNCACETEDGVEFLANYLQKEHAPDWIVPALPLHLAAEWLLLRLGKQRLRRIALPAEIERLVPNPMRGRQGDIYVSHADFRCPDNCDEPEAICTITRKKRKQNMYQILGNLCIEPYESLNIRSRQLQAGVGGYRTEQLLELMEKVERTRGPILLSTACRCHGVITGLERL
ncbi:MAG: potassium transporter [Desulfobacterales bacterium]|nr:MAG: potassium transporter [Desulfobacterales bacterium]